MRRAGGDDAVDVDAVALAVPQRGAQVVFGRTHVCHLLTRRRDDGGPHRAPPEPASTRSRDSAREQLLLTVPTGSPSVAAVSCSDRSQ